VINIHEKKEIDQFLIKLENRYQEVSQEVQITVKEILDRIKQTGDEALFEFALKFDKIDLNKYNICLTQTEIESNLKNIPAGFMDILKQSAKNIKCYHEKGKRTSWINWEENGVILGQRIMPLNRVGVYVPGGRAVYPSSLLMAAIPAQVAGVKEIVVVTPPDSEGSIHPSILAAAQVAGIREIYRIGGAQAVAALAFGTDLIPRVDKIVGPGNIYVAEAKRQVFGHVDIDMVAGPSEVVIFADETANPDYVASDILAQAEHDPLASSICVTTSLDLANQIKEAVVKQSKILKRKEILQVSLKLWGGILVASNKTEAIKLVNELAPEHLGLHCDNAWNILEEIQHAGAIFLGHFSPETVGDYWAGPNHILPTNRTARFASPLDTDDFIKKSSLISYSKTAIEKNAKSIITFAETEGLDGHANAVRKRIE
jgi:histidinol dehydrogenase